MVVWFEFFRLFKKFVVRFMKIANFFDILNTHTHSTPHCETKWSLFEPKMCLSKK